MAIRGAPSAGRRLLSGETNLAALFHFLRKVAHGFLRDVASFAARKRGFGIIEDFEGTGVGLASRGTTRLGDFAVVKICDSIVYYKRVDTTGH